MESRDIKLLYQWFKNRQDLIDFELYPIEDDRVSNATFVEQILSGEGSTCVQKKA
jgi:hypothetical protein